MVWSNCVSSRGGLPSSLTENSLNDSKDYIVISNHHNINGSIHEGKNQRQGMIPWNNNNNNNTISSSCPVEVAFSDSSSGSISGSIKGNRLVVPTSGQKGLNKKVCERILSFPGSSSSRFFNNNAASLFHSESPSSEEDGSTNFPCSFLHVYMYSWYRFVQLAKSCLHST